MRYLLLVCTFLSCAGSKNNSKEVGVITGVSYTEGITFISFHFERKKESISISHVETLYSTGHLKQENPYMKNAEAKYLLQFRNAKGKPLLDCYINDPFTEDMDLFSENGKIEKIRVEHQEKTINLRVQRLLDSPTQVAVFELSTALQYLTIIPLNKL